MSQSNSYLTISEPAKGLFKDRGSKFLGFAYPVTDEAEIKQYLTLLRKEHAAARHHCYAWRLGPEKETTRANDDGEPESSAGKPILTQIQSHNLHHVLIVVVRYFGGTLLGVNGLINAYKQAASDALANAVITKHFRMDEFKLLFGSAEQGQVMRLLKQSGAKIISNDYDQQQEIVFQVKKQDSELLEKRFNELYKTKLEFIRTI